MWTESSSVNCANLVIYLVQLQRYKKFSQAVTFLVCPV